MSDFAASRLVATSRRSQIFVERADADEGIDGIKPVLFSLFSLCGLPLRNHRIRRMAQQAARQSEVFDRLDEQALDLERRQVAARLRASPSDRSVIVGALALVRVACHRQLAILPYVEQMTAGAALMLGYGLEMATGEGKTIAAAFPAACFGLAGRAVHVVTTNDYLAQRDGALLAPVFQSLGLSSAIILHDMTPEARREAYKADIVHVSNKEVAFDYLRDRLVTETSVGDPEMFRKSRRLGAPVGKSAEMQVQRGLDVAIIDEADSVLIDEAGTPLLISGLKPSDLEQKTVALAFAIACALQPESDYIAAQNSLSVDLTPRARQSIEAETAALAGVWRQRIRREALVSAALVARHLLTRDKHYIVREGKVVIVDEHTGRTMEDRFWEQDLHLLVEHKEGCQLSSGKKSMASISFQRFFRRYRTLCGMSGTLKEVAGELARIYRLPMARVRRRRPSQLKSLGTHVAGGRDALWAQVVQETGQHRSDGRAVLIGVSSVAEADRASAALVKAGIPHRVLSAAQGQDEAIAIAGAGQAGAVTVATSMAGRGTDIQLGTGVAAAGGLVVLLCELHESGRVDRQLIGRCARQGDPGAYAVFLSCEDPILRAVDGFGRWRLKIGLVPQRVFRKAQRRLERLHAANRLNLVRRDQALAKVLAFAGGLD